MLHNSTLNSARGCPRTALVLCLPGLLFSFSFDHVVVTLERLSWRGVFDAVGCHNSHRCLRTQVPKYEG